MRKAGLCFIYASAVALAQNPEAGHLERVGNQTKLVVDQPRPVDAAAITLVKAFGLRVSVEDPAYIYKDDIKDVTTEVARGLVKRPILIPEGGRLEMSFAANDDGSPADVTGLLRSLVDTANRQFPFAYRLDMDGDLCTIVPTRTRDQLGNVVETIPLLDRRVTIPLGTRSIAESAKLMAQSLSAQTGLRVNCCQSFVAGVPWGITETEFEARDEPARNVLKRLINSAAAREGRVSRNYWLQRCSPLPSEWCFINLGWAVRDESNPRVDQSTIPASPRPNADPSRWFVKAP